jgi:hypothetical protein
MTSLDHTIKSAIFEFENCPDILRHQIKIFSSGLLKDDKKVATEYNRWKQEFESVTLGGREVSGKELRDLFLHACVFKYVSALKISEPDRFPALEIYNEHGDPIIEINSLMTEGNFVKLFRGRFIDEKFSNGYGTEKDVVIKLYESRDNKNTTEYEVNIYRKLGDPCPSLGVNAYLWNIPVLILRPMEKIGKDDDEIEVGVQILKQLPKLHRLVGTHSDFKLANVLRLSEEDFADLNSKHSKQIPQTTNQVSNSNPPLLKNETSSRRHNSRKPSHHSSLQSHSSLQQSHSSLQPQSSTQKGGLGGSVSAPYKYWIIDYGGCPRERLGVGFKRRTWTKKWALQCRGNVMTTPKYDLLELGHTLTAIKYCRENNTKKYPNPKQRTFTGCLKQYMEYAENIDDSTLDHKEYGPHYDALIQILLNGYKKSSASIRHHHSVEKKNNDNSISRKILKPIIISKREKSSRHKSKSSSSSSSSSKKKSSRHKSSSKKGKREKSSRRK